MPQVSLLTDLIANVNQSEQLYVSDPRAVHEILVKETDSVFRHPQFNYEWVFIAMLTQSNNANLDLSLLNICFGPGLGGASGGYLQALELDQVTWIMQVPCTRRKGRQAWLVGLSGELLIICHSRC